MRATFRMIGIGILLALAARSAKADSFDFTIQGATSSATGTFTTTAASFSAICGPNSGGCYSIMAVTGQFNAVAISTMLTLTDYFGILSSTLQLLPVGAGLGFQLADNRMWRLSNNRTPDQGLMLFGIATYDPRNRDFAHNGFTESVTLTVTRTLVPEPATMLLLLCAGLIGLLRIHSARPRGIRQSF